MTKMAAMPIYGKNPSKILTDFHETWYVASGTLAHHKMFVKRMTLGRGNKSLYKWSWSHDQDGHHAHIW